CVGDGSLKRCGYVHPVATPADAWNVLVALLSADSRQGFEPGFPVDTEPHRFGRSRVERGEPGTSPLEVRGTNAAFVPKPDRQLWIAAAVAHDDGGVGELRRIERRRGVGEMMIEVLDLQIGRQRNRRLRDRVGLDVSVAVRSDPENRPERLHGKTARGERFAPRTGDALVLAHADNASFVAHLD